jgi:hypothetical protein
LNYGYIYKTSNLINNKIYIGQKKGRLDISYFGSGLLLKNALNKNGKHNFKLEVIAYANTKKELDNLEIAFIADYRKQFGIHKLYNISEGGSSPIPNSITREKMKFSHLGKANPMKGKKYPYQARYDLRGKPTWNKGLTKETDKRINYFRPTTFKKGQISYWKGKNFSTKHIEYLRLNHKGMIGKKHSQETIIKMRLSALKRNKIKEKS